MVLCLSTGTQVLDHAEGVIHKSSTGVFNITIDCVLKKVMREHGALFEYRDPQPHYLAPRFKGKSLPFPLGPDHAEGVIHKSSTGVLNITIDCVLKKVMR